MSYLAESSSYLSGLRERATNQLTQGVRSDLSRASTSEAMAALFQLASSPSTAGDALALLHELQVHQVEVDMQHEELLQSRADLENHLARQTNLVERAPAAFLVLDEAGVVCEINQAGVRLLAAARNDVLGQSFTRFLSPASNSQLKIRLTQANDDDAVRESFDLQLLPLQARATRQLLCTVGREMSSNRFVLVLMELSA